MAKAQETGSTLFPVDSEHNAVFQSLVGHQHSDIEKIILTASGGPFRDMPLEKFQDITREEALNHPNWEIGNKITIDSATMMRTKGWKSLKHDGYLIFPSHKLRW